MFRKSTLPALWLIVSCAITARAGDWPQFLGPARSGAAAADEQVAAKWPADAPPIVWTKTLGQGFSGPVVSDGKLVVFHREGADAVVECCDAATGKQRWAAKYPTNYRDDFGFDEGPRSTPAIAGGRVYTFGAEGMLSCWNLADGGKVWSVDVRERFKSDKGFFGPACSPLVDGDLVILHVGGKEAAGVVAFDARDGTARWKSTDDEAGYASPVAATVNGRRMILCFTREGLVGLAPADGAVKFRFPWRSRSDASVNAATPLVVGDQVFLSASYGTGAVLLRMREGAPPQEVWSGDESLSNHYATSVHRDGFLYGFDGRQEQTPRLRCVEWATGKVRWTKEDFGAGTLLLAGGRLVILTEKGEVVIANALPEKFEETARARVIKSECRAHPALANGFLYARDKDALVCVDLRGR